MSDAISLTIVNSTNGTIPVSLLGNNADLADNANATTEYQYDITALTLATENMVSVEFRRSGTTEWSTFVAVLSQPTINGVLLALNSLGIGSFFTYTSGPNTYLANYDDNYDFGVINIWDKNTAGIQGIYKWLTTGAGGDINIQQGFLAPIWLNPTTASGALDLTTAPLDFFGTSSNNPGGMQASIYNVSTGQYVYKQNIPASTPWAAPEFNPAAGSIYRFLAFDL